nr:PRD domain-containing protein [Vallitaleaceae bacterium]
GADIVSLEPWFLQYNIDIIKRPGLGIMLDGDEISKRKAIVALIYEHFHVFDLIDMVTQKPIKKIDVGNLKQHIDKSIFELLDVDSLGDIKDLIGKFEKEMGYELSDNAYIALIIRFAVTLKRRGFWGDIYIEEQAKKEMLTDKIYIALIQLIEASVDSRFNHLNSTELIYLAIHLKGAKLRETGDYNKISMIEDFKVIQLAKEFIHRVELETGIYLGDNEKLLVGLVKHLRPSLYRLKMNLDIINPLVEEIKMMYPKLFQTIKVCASVIEEREGVKVTEDEVAYLATHIGAIIEKDHREIVKKYQVVIACIYGIGASQLLVSEIEKHFNNIQIVRVMSVFGNDLDTYDFSDVDLIITTVPISGLTIPTIVVNTVIKEIDIQNINKALANYKPRHIYNKGTNALVFRDKIAILEQYSKIIIQICDNFTYDSGVRLKTMPSVIDFISKSLAKSSQETIALKQAFMDREEKGSTILMKKGMQLLHCRADIQKGVCLKVVQLTEPIIVESNEVLTPVDTIIVMVGPIVLNQKVLEVLSEISRYIIAKDFADIIKSATEDDIRFTLNGILDKLYQKIVMSI